jgi:hypothetical protein
MASFVEGDGSNEDRLRMAVKAWPVIEAAVGLHFTPYDLVVVLSGLGCGAGTIVEQWPLKGSGSCRGGS